jgi:hypothetical protein
MAIRIDLLPRYVGLRRWFKRLLVACLSLVGVFAAVLFVLYYRDQLRLDTLKTNRDAFQKVATLADTAQAAADKATNDAKPFQDTVNFFVNAGRTGPERASLLDIVHRYIYTGAVINSLDISDGQNAKFTAMVKTPDEYANFLNNLRRGTAPAGILFTDLPAGAGIPGYNNGLTTTAQGGQPTAQAAPAQAGAAAEATAQSVPYIVFPLTINANGKLLNPIVVPAEPGAAPVAPDAGQPGAPPAPPTQ